jgi:CRP-like cAMP-binding protein
VVAETDAVVLSLGAEAIARLEEDDPRLATRLHKLLARLLATKLRQTNTWLSHLR